ncbi:helix-turn-helix domain-containing protein [Desulfuribacillus stibiiarsenatis]|uniref:helix-turn-helix domain-containing protein n=1 Tax=Desulfuribacillus stibiiarsenatis TaxID=1390249 RepID=UPI001FE1EFB6|nr:helix-turn-helix domain-containing protein [Desulfuribacillus stibiiarsenatis]
MITRRTLTMKEASQWLGISYHLLAEKARKGDIPHSRIGSRVLFRAESLENWLNQQEELKLSR